MATRGPEDRIDTADTPAPDAVEFQQLPSPAVVERFQALEDSGPDQEAAPGLKPIAGEPVRLETRMMAPGGGEMEPAPERKGPEYGERMPREFGEGGLYDIPFEFGIAADFMEKRGGWLGRLIPSVLDNLVAVPIHQGVVTGAKVGISVAKALGSGGVGKVVGIVAGLAAGAVTIVGEFIRGIGTLPGAIYRTIRQEQMMKPSPTHRDRMLRGRRQWSPRNWGFKMFWEVWDQMGRFDAKRGL